MCFAFPPHLIFPENVFKSGPIVTFVLLQIVLILTGEAGLHFLFPSLFSKRSWNFYLINNKLFIFASGYIQIQTRSCEGKHCFQCQPCAPLFLLQSVSEKNDHFSKTWTSLQISFSDSQLPNVNWKCLLLWQCHSLNVWRVRWPKQARKGDIFFKFIFKGNYTKCNFTVQPKCSFCCLIIVKNKTVPYLIGKILQCQGTCFLRLILDEMVNFNFSHVPWNNI